jgi:reductive dehalogenase
MQTLDYIILTALSGINSGNPLNIILFIIGALLSVFFIYAWITSMNENEKRAANILIIFGIVLLAPVVFLLFNSFQVTEISGWILAGIYISIPLLLFLPIDKRHRQERVKPTGRIDERDVMFSRNHYIPGTDRYKEYYSRNPEKEITDNKFRKKPGLLQPGTSFYDSLRFNAAKASFDTVNTFQSIVEGEPAKTQITFTPEEATSFIKKWAIKLGAKDVGITLLKDYHKYSVVGRGPDFGKPVKLNHKFAIAFTVEMDRGMIDAAPLSPTVLETSQQYLEAGKVAVQVAVLIRRLGYAARAHIDANYRVVCPLVARDAGLGEIGRMGILMTPKQGPRVRISVVTTDIPLITDIKKADPTVDDFCKICKKCAHTCPGQAISFDDMAEINGIKRWQINQEKCFTYWCQAGTDCGKCMSVCPYSHPDNFFHNIVRFGIRRNYFFRKIAVSMDDLFYGKKPKSKVASSKVRVS